MEEVRAERNRPTYLNEDSKESEELSLCSSDTVLLLKRYRVPISEQFEIGERTIATRDRTREGNSPESNWILVGI